ncbi:MAG: hypothetical protein JJT85_11600 [Chromatiales bacterium]|nr:hypothetical protein [Chromatiales bacterium]
MNESGDRLTEWIRLMVHEVDQKQAEAEEDREEQARRGPGAGDQRGDAKDGKQD